MRQKAEAISSASVPRSKKSCAAFRAVSTPWCSFVTVPVSGSPALRQMKCPNPALCGQYEIVVMRVPSAWTRRRRVKFSTDTGRFVGQ